MNRLDIIIYDGELRTTTEKDNVADALAEFMDALRSLGVNVNDSALKIRGVLRGEDGNTKECGVWRK